MNLADMVRDAAEDFPAKAALLFHGRAINFSDLDERVDRTAATLASLGVSKGDRVALVIGNVPEFVASFYGILRAGAVACPLNVMLTPEEMSYILADAGAKLAITQVDSLPGLLSVRDRLAEARAVEEARGEEVGQVVLRPGAVRVPAAERLDPTKVNAD